MKNQILKVFGLLLGIVLFAGQVQAADILVSVEKQPMTVLSAKDLCDMVHYGANRVQLVETTCLKIDGKQFIDPQVREARATGFYGYHVIIKEVSNGLDIRVQHWLKTDDTEPAQTEFKIFRDRKRQWVKFVEDLGANIQYYDLNKDALKTDLLRGVISDSRKIKVDKDANFIEIATGKRVTGKQAYQIYKTEGDLQKNSLIFALEITTIFAYYSYRYYQNHKNKLDWDYSWVEGMEKKIKGEALLFDDNDRPTNLGHVDAGNYFYLACRGNGFSAPESFLCAALSSAFWEIVVEYKEVLSYNDLWTTIVGGSIQGESHFQAARAMRCGGTKVGRILSAILNPFEEIAYWTGGKVNLTCPAKETANSLSIGYMDKDGKTFVPISLESTVYDLPTDETGKLKVFIPGVFHSNLRMEWDVNPDGTHTDLTYLSQIAYTALYKHNLSEDEVGRKSGYQVVVSAASSYRRDERHSWSQYEDAHFIGTVNILGPRVQMNGLYKGKEVRMVLEVYRNFALVKSASLKEYIEENGDEDLRTVLRNHGYYQAYGWTQRAAIEGRAGKWEGGAEAEFNQFDAIRDFDRYQSILKFDPKLNDKVQNTRFFVRYNATRRIAFEAVYETFSQSSTFNESYRAHEKEKRISGKVKYRF